MTARTIDTPTARRMIEAAAINGASIVGRPGGWSVMLKIGMKQTPLGTQRTDRPRIWRSLDSCATYLRHELHILHIDGIDATNYSINHLIRPRRTDTAERMRAAHAAAAYDKWFRAQVQTALDDARPTAAHAKVMTRMQAIIDKKRKQHAGRKAKR